MKRVYTVSYTHLSRIWVVRSLGIDPASGDEILLKRNGEMTSAVNWSANDVVPIGNTEPKWHRLANSFANPFYP